MNRSLTTLLILLGVFLSHSVDAQVYTPKRGTAERTAILAPVRSLLEAKIKKKVIFVVDHMKVEGTWAFFKGTPKTGTGGPINYKGTVLESEAEEADEMTVALLRKVGGKWTVVEHGFFTTDVWWYELWKQHPGCPKAIFDH